MKNVICSKPGHTRITWSKLENSPGNFNSYNTFNDSSILIRLFHGTIWKWLHWRCQSRLCNIHTISSIEFHLLNMTCNYNSKQVLSVVNNNHSLSKFSNCWIIHSIGLDLTNRNNHLLPCDKYVAISNLIKWSTVLFKGMICRDLFFQTKQKLIIISFLDLKNLFLTQYFAENILSNILISSI
jgi:hypothetical protein